MRFSDVQAVSISSRAETYLAWRKLESQAAELLASLGLRQVPGYVRVAELAPDRPLPFGGSECYYQTRSRDVRLCFASDELFFCLCPAPQTVLQHFARDVVVVLRPEFRHASALRIFASACQRLARHARADLIIKNVPCSLVPALLSYGFRPYRDGEFWNPHEPFDEETYPQVVWLAGVSARSTLQHDSSLPDRLGASFFSDAPDPPELARLYSRWRAWFLARHPQSDPSWMDRYFEVLFPLLPRHSLVLVLRSKPNLQLLGFIAAERVAPSQLDACVLISLPGPWGQLLTRQLYVEAGRLGYRYVNCGGSETESLHRFKSRVAPSTSLASAHLVYAEAGDGLSDLW